MPALRFDTHHAFNRLRSAGADETVAHALVTVIRNAFTSHEATPTFDAPRARQELLEAQVSPALTDAFITTLQEARGDIPYAELQVELGDNPYVEVQVLLDDISYADPPN